MKLSILLLLAAVTCSPPNQVKTTNVPDQTVEVYRIAGMEYTYKNDRDVMKIFIDGCMYIAIMGYRSQALAHAGNCPNQIHNQNCK